MSVGGVEQPAAGERAGGGEAGGSEPRGLDPEVLERVFVELRSVCRDLLDWIRVGLDRARLGVGRGGYRLVVFGWLFLAGATATIVASYFVVDGVAGWASRIWGGQLWAGRLSAGLAVLSSGAILLAVRRVRARRAALRRLEAKYDSPAPAGDRGDGP